MDCNSTTLGSKLTFSITSDCIIKSSKTSRCKFLNEFSGDRFNSKVIVQVIDNQRCDKRLVVAAHPLLPLKPVVRVIDNFMITRSRVAALTKFEILAGNPITKRRYAKNDKNKNH